MCGKVRIFKKKGNWYFIGCIYQGAHRDLYVLLMAAKARGE